MESDNFVSQFYTLHGTSAEERRRNLFRLLNKHSNLAAADLDKIAATLKPRNHLERIFWLESLIYFKRFDELLKEFQSGDDLAICKITKQPWFFDKLFTNIEPEHFVNHVLPSMSFAVRLKVLKKFRLDEEKSDEVFDALHHRYGVFIANNILHRCSVGKIRKILEEEPVKLTFAQLQRLVDKDPSLILLYFEQTRPLNHKNPYFMIYNPILAYIAQKNPLLFCELRKKYDLVTSFGRRTTKKFVKVAGEEVISKPDDYLGILRYSSLVRTLGGNFRLLLLKVFPETSAALPHSNVYRLLAHFSRNGRFNLYKSTYNTIYFKKFGEDSELITPNELKLIADVDDRQSLAKRLMDKGGDDNYLKYFRASDCFDLLRAKFDFSTTLQRTKYVQIMTESCILNRDLDTFLKVAQLLNTRLKNDTSSIFLDVLKKVLKTKFFAKRLTEEHWGLFYEMLAMSDVKKDLSYVHFKYIFKYVEFLFNNNKSISNVVGRFGCEALEKGHLRQLLSTKPKLFKAVLLELIKIDLNRTEESLRLVHVLIIYATLDYNKNNPKSRICLRNNPKFLATCEYILVNKTSSYLNACFPNAISHMITTKNESNQIKQLQELFFQSYHVLGSEATLVWFLRNSPELVQRHFDCVFKNSATGLILSDDKVLRSLKRCTNMDLEKKIIQLCLANLENKNCYKRESLIKPLSMLMTSSDYAELAKSYEPISSEVETKDETTREKLKILLKLAYYLKNISPPETGLPIALEFWTNENHSITTSLAALYSLFYRTPENKLRKFIEELNNFKGISVRKHGVILTCVIFDQASVLACLSTTSVPSLLHVLRFFVKNPSDELWKLVRTELLKIEKTSTEMLKLVTETDAPLRFRNRYNELLWDILTRHQQPHLLKMLLLKLLFDNTSFCSKVINQTLTEFEEANEFVANFLINTGNVNVVIEALEKFKKRSWNSKTQSPQSKQKLRSFITKLFEMHMKSKTEKKFPADEFLLKFQKTFSSSEAFHETVLVNLMTFKGKSSEELAKSIVGFSRELTKTFGPMVLYVLADVISDYLKCFFERNSEWVSERNSERFQFCYALFKLRESVDEDLLVIKLLPKSPAEDVTSVECYKSMLEEWQKSSNNMLQLQLSL